VAQVVEDDVGDRLVFKAVAQVNAQCGANLVPNVVRGFSGYRYLDNAVEVDEAEFHDGEKDFFFVFEVVVEGGRGDIKCFADVANAGREVAFLVEELRGVDHDFELARGHF